MYFAVLAISFFLKVINQCMMSLPKSVCVPPTTQQAAVNHDQEEYSLMQQKLLFSENVKDLKNLSKQLYSASEYFELSYSKEKEKKVVIESLKDYVIQALVNSVDHLGSIAFKLNSFLDNQKQQNLLLEEVSTLELRLSCVEQRLETCQQFINLGGLSQQSLAMDQPPNHHKHYKYHHNIRRPTSIQLLHTCSSPSSLPFGSSLSPQPAPSRQGSSSFLYTTTCTTVSKPENRALLPRSGSLILNRSTSPNDRRRYQYPLGQPQPQPQRTVSLSSLGDREKRREQYYSSIKSKSSNSSSKGRQLLKGMLSLRSSRCKKDHDDNDTHTLQFTN